MQPPLEPIMSRLAGDQIFHQLIPLIRNCERLLPLRLVKVRGSKGLIDLLDTGAPPALLIGEQEDAV